MLNDEQHAELRVFLRRAIEADDGHERKHAIEDAAHLVGGITFQKGFVSPEGMKAGIKP